jgi:hypothetical protein
MNTTHQRIRPTFLCIAPPPESPTAPPAGAAYLLGYLKKRGWAGWDFLDLRLGVPDVHAPTWTYSGVFGESYVLDVPDLPLVLQLLRAIDEDTPIGFERSRLFDRYCLERGILPSYLHSYLSGLNRYFEAVFAQIPRIDFVGFTVWTTNFFATLLACAHLKRRKSPPFIIAGGPQVTSSRASAELGLRSRLFDLVGLGEGEETLFEVYSQFCRGGQVSPGLPGTLSMDEAGEFHRVERPLLPISAIPTPSFSEMQLEAYQREAGWRILPLQFSRGCTDRCGFCSEWAFWRRFRQDAPDRIVEQISELQTTYGVDFIVFMDSLLNGMPRRLYALAQALIRGRVGVYWAGFMRAQMDSESARLLARAGCHDVFVGVESFSNKTLELMRKRRTKAENIRALEAFLDAGIAVTAGLMPGFPGDSRSAFINSVRILRDMQERYPGRLSLQEEAFAVQPNTPVYYSLTDSGLTPTCWPEEYLDVAPRYKDITSRLYCTVEGESQGIERLGRLRIVQALSRSSCANAGFSFIPSHEEHLSVSYFEFEHIAEGWSLARKRSDAGHIYGLLINEDEREELEALQEESSLESLPTRRMRSTVSRLERKHVIPPSRIRPRIVRSIYCRHARADCVYTISPFVVVRRMGNSKTRQVLVAHVVNDRWRRRSARQGALIAIVSTQYLREEQIWKRAVETGVTKNRRWLARRIHDLKEDGTFVICDTGC